MIISSLGVLMKARELAPEVEIHLSTQANALIHGIIKPTGI